MLVEALTSSLLSSKRRVAPPSRTVECKVRCVRDAIVEMRDAEAVVGPVRPYNPAGAGLRAAGSRCRGYRRARRCREPTSVRRSSRAHRARPWCVRVRRHSAGQRRTRCRPNGRRRVTSRLPVWCCASISHPVAISPSLSLIASSASNGRRRIEFCPHVERSDGRPGAVRLVADGTGADTHGVGLVGPLCADAGIEFAAIAPVGFVGSTTMNCGLRSKSRLRTGSLKVIVPERRSIS